MELMGKLSSLKFRLVSSYILLSLLQRYSGALSPITLNKRKELTRERGLSIVHYR